MLTLFSLLGAVFAGVVAEGAIALSHPNDAEEPEEGEAGAAIPPPGDLLVDEDGIATDDIAEPEDEGLTYLGDAGGNLVDGGETGDDLDGGAGDDQVNAKGGDDTITGGDGDDLIWAGDGADLVAAADGDDQVQGGAGDDTLAGGVGDDSLAGHAGDDSLSGDAGADTLLGGAGDDTLDGGEGADWLAGNDGNDLLVGGGGADTLDGGAGEDTLFGTFPEGDDGGAGFLNGGGGADQLWLGAGDFGHGGEGSDDFLLSQWLHEGGYATISDYNAAEDQIVVVFDPAIHADPQITVEPLVNTDSVQILLDGQPVATVNGSVDVQDIRLLAA